MNKSINLDNNRLLHPSLTRQIFGHTQVVNNLLLEFYNKKLPHSILFSGDSGIGKASIAYLLAKHILTNTNGEKDLTGNFLLDVTNHDVLKIEKNSNPDLLVIETTDTKKEIVMDDSKTIGNFLSLTSFKSPYRVVIIDSIDKMNINATNALLKTLEEPSYNVFFFLINHNVKMIPTIKSRSKTITLPHLSYDDFSSAISSKGIKMDNQSEIYSLSGGRVGLAIKFYNLNILSLYKQILDIITDTNINLERETELINEIVSNKLDFDCFIYLINFLYNRMLALYYNTPSTDIVENERNILMNIIDKIKIPDNPASFHRIISKLDKTNDLFENMNTLNLDQKQTINSVFAICRSQW